MKWPRRETQEAWEARLQRMTRDEYAAQLERKFRRIDLVFDVIGYGLIVLGVVFSTAFWLWGPR